MNARCPALEPMAAYSPPPMFPKLLEEWGQQLQPDRRVGGSPAL